MLFSKVFDLAVLSVTLLGSVSASPLNIRATTCGAGLTPCGRDCFRASEGLYHCENDVLKQGPGPAAGQPAPANPPSASPGTTACGAGLTPCGRDCYRASEGRYHCANNSLQQGPAPGGAPAPAPPATPAPPTGGGNPPPSSPPPSSGSPPPANPGGRTIQVVNSCPEDIWIGIQGNPLLANGGLFLPRGQSQNIQAPNTWTAGRIWPRTGCAPNAQGHLVCETGDCGSAFNNFGVECKGIGGQAPATLAEFTLQTDGKTDFYDLSNVDGHSVGIKIEAFGTQVNNPALGRFNCGNPQCAMDMSKCPPELSRKTSSGRTVCLAISAAVRDANLRAAFSELSEIFNNADTLSLVSCSCDCGENCGCTDPRSKHCCSPYNNDPNERGGKCRVEDWPTSRSPGAGSAFPARYDQVFKQQCPDAYSWQFDDHQSTYQCLNANYRVTFCG
ncbi:hypothetical protein HDU88_003569 [Geranomyces variabilis]|nr:hypothetical protein HDU88_003569 [Geranomyces variabilis]